MKGMRASALSSEFCTVQVLKGPKNLSALRNSEVSEFRSILKYCINSAPIGTASKWPHKRGVRYRECPLMEVPLYTTQPMPDLLEVFLESLPHSLIV